MHWKCFKNLEGIRWKFCNFRTKYDCFSSAWSQACVLLQRSMQSCFYLEPWLTELYLPRAGFQLFLSATWGGTGGARSFPSLLLLCGGRSSCWITPQRWSQQGARWGGCDLYHAGAWGWSGCQGHRVGKWLVSWVWRRGEESHYQLRQMLVMLFFLLCLLKSLQIFCDLPWEFLV